MKEAILLAGGILGCAGFVISLVCVAILTGVMRATHSVQYVPHDNGDTFKPEPDLLAENEKALLDQVGKKKKEKPTVVEDQDAIIEEIAQTELKF